jgi:DNA replication protein DnaD
MSNTNYILVHKGQYFTSNREFTSNIHLAYTYSEEQAKKAVEEFSYMGMRVTMQRV